MDLCVDGVVDGEVDGVEVVRECDMVQLIEHCHGLLVCGGLRPHLSGIRAAEKRRERR